MALNTPDEILKFARLDLSIVKVEEVENALAFASDYVTFLSPVEDSERSDRVQVIACLYFLHRVVGALQSDAPSKMIRLTISRLKPCGSRRYGGRCAGLAFLQCGCCQVIRLATWRRVRDQIGSASRGGSAMGSAARRCSPTMGKSKRQRHALPVAK